MSKDIRSFFTVVSKNSNGSSNKTSSAKPNKLKRAIIDSDDDDTIIESTPQKSNSSTAVRKRKHKVVVSSDSEEESTHKTKNSPKKNKTKNNPEQLKPVNIVDIFTNTPIKQSKVELPAHIEKDTSNVTSKKQKKTRKSKTEVGIHNDEDFEKTLLELDDDIFIENVDILDKTIEDALRNTNEEGTTNKPKIQTEKKRKRKSSSEGTPHKSAKIEHTDSGIDPDQEAFEKKRYSAMLYQKYKNRGGPKHHGEKEIPQGKPDCLKNVTFLRTGVLDSLESNEFENLVKEHGGRVVHAVSKKVNYLVVGDDPGPAKLDKARGFNIPEISEDDLFDMILIKSGMKPKFSKTKSDASCESGIATEDEPLPKLKEKKNISMEKDVKIVAKEKVRDNKSEQKERKSGVSEKSHEPISKQLPGEKTGPVKESINRGPAQDKIAVKKEPVSPKSPTQKTVKRIQTEVKSESIKFESVQVEAPDYSMTWTERYKPTDVKNIIGQQGDGSNMNKLKKWLQNWYRNQQPAVRKKIPRPSPWAKNDDGAYYKAALLSGPPGVGKTTTATLVSKELGFDVVEFNASDTRSKRLLHEEVSQLLSTNTIAGFATGKKKTDKKRVLLMDEVDGMAGNEDRGGIQELINLIKNTSVPIICMCNDRNHQKMRSLVNYCFDLRFSKPRLEQIRGAMMSICFKEGIKITPVALSEVIQGTGCDIRQTLNHLSLWSSADKNMSVESMQKESKIAKKDTILGPWEVVRKVFSQEEQKNMSLSDKTRLFFYDYSIGPLFVQENYLNVTPNCNSKESIRRAALAADAISIGDLIDGQIRNSNSWALLETQAIFSSVLPGYYMSGNITKKINFPSWLGKNSSANKHKRMLSELHAHMRMSISGNRLALKLDYLVPLRNAIINPLRKYGTEGVHQAMEVMKSYNLLREDLNNLIELCQWKDMKNPFNDIDAKVKSAFTRIYNKEAPLLPFAANIAVSKKKATDAMETDPLNEEEIAESDEEENDDVTADAMIKVKTKQDAKNKKDSTIASTSKAKGSSSSNKGRAKKKK